jgi:hypothetical protein
MGDSTGEWQRAAKTLDGGSFRISYEWKEMLTYWEGDHGLVFDCAWGVDPGYVYVPAPDLWDNVVPKWLTGRRDEVVERLRQHSGHVVMDDDRAWSARAEGWRLRQQS